MAAQAVQVAGGRTAAVGESDAVVEVGELGRAVATGELAGAIAQAGVPVDGSGRCVPVGAPGWRFVSQA